LLKTRLIIAGMVAFSVLPLIELVLLIEVGRRIGTLWTIGIVIGTGILGGVLLGVEGHGVLRRVRHEIGQARIPQDQIIDGAIIVVGALLLITPGIITDILGILFMFAPTRFFVRMLVKRWIRRYVLINL